MDYKITLNEAERELAYRVLECFTDIIDNEPAIGRHRAQVMASKWTRDQVRELLVKFQKPSINKVMADGV